MTTFATPFTSFTNMQTEEDFMEVSNDPERRNAMAMEEDNFDIDLDLGDDPQTGHDEDSMMDDGPTGQDGDQDQAMDDDYQEQGDQDDVILNDIDDQPPVTEVPMTEDVPTWEQNPTASIQNLFTAEVDPATPPLPSFATQSPLAVTTSQPTDSTQVPAEQTFTVTAGESGNDADNLESIRTLYNDEPLTLGTNADTKPQNVTQATFAEQETTNEVAPATKPVSESGDRSHEEDHAVAHNEAASLPIEDETKHAPTSIDSGTPDNIPASVAGAAIEHTDPVEPEKGNSNAELEHDKEAGEAALSDELYPRESDDPAGSDEHPTNMPEPEPVHPILVTYQGHQMSLFPPTSTDEGTPETYLLPDASTFDQPISSFLHVCCSTLSASLEKNEDVEVLFPSFGFTVRKYDPQAAEYTLRHIAELCVQFQQCDGVEHPLPLHVQLVVVSSLAGRMSYLYDLAGESKGLKYVEELFSSTFDDGLGDGDFDNYAPEADGAFEDTAGGQDSDPRLEGETSPKDVGTTAAASGEDPQESTTTGNVDQAEHVAASIESNATDEADKTQASVAASQVEAPPENDDDHEDRGEGAHDEQAEPFIEEPLKAKHEQEHETEVYDDDQEANENAQTAEEINFDDEEWDIEEPTDTDNANVADAQRSAFEQPSDMSQSLHSATDPDANGITQSESKGTLPTRAEGDDEPVDVQPEGSESSSTTLQAADKSQLSAAVENAEDDDDIFGDDDDYTGVTQTETLGNFDDGFEDEIDFGDDEPQAKSPTLKRIRSEVDQAGDEADDNEDHPLKRSRSG